MNRQWKKDLEHKQYINNLFQLIQQVLQEGEQYTYKTIIELLQLNYQECRGGNSKNKIIKLLNLCMDFEKIPNTQKYIIKEIYKKPNFRNRKSNTLQIPNCCIIEEYFNCGGIYKIQYQNDVYIGSTLRLRDRFMQHYKNEGHAHTKTYNLLQQGGTFELLWLMPNNSTIDDLRIKEQEYINLYKNIKTYNLLNSQDATKTINTTHTLYATELTQLYKKYIRQATDNFFKQREIKSHLPKDFDIEAFKTEMINKL